MAIKLITKTFTDIRGTLAAIDENQLGFSVKRLFNIYNLDKKLERGGHGHKKAIIAMSCISGSCDVYINDGKQVSIYQLNKPEEYLILQPHEWHKMNNFSDNTIIQVLASETYNPDDYFYEEPKLIK